MFMCVLFYLGQLNHFILCFGDGVTNLNEPPSSFFLPPHHSGLGAGSILYRAIVNNKQCEMRGLFMSLVIHYEGCTRLPGCIRLRNDLYCVGWDVKLYSLTPYFPLSLHPFSGPSPLLTGVQSITPGKLWN